MINETPEEILQAFDEFDVPLFDSEDHEPYSKVWRDEDLDRVVRERNRLQAEVDSTTELFKAEIKRIQERLSKISKPKIERIEHLDEALLEYHRKTGQKTVHYPSGTVTVRKRPVSLVVEDTEQAISWAKEHLPEAVSIKETFSKSEAKKHVSDGKIVTCNGELIELEDSPFRMSEEEYTIKVKLEEN